MAARLSPVVATFTRLCFDGDSFRRHRFLVLGLPVLITALCIAAALVYGRWLLATGYLYWQWFHYTRQSYGVARIYRRKVQAGGSAGDRLVDWTIHAVPLWCILHRSHQRPASFLGTELWILPVPFWLVAACAAIALALVTVHAAREIRAMVAGAPARGDTIYLLSHNLIFVVAYVVIDDLDTGWLVVSVWHNAQYILLVWMFNNNRFERGVDPRHRFLSTLSQSKNVALYIGVCLALSTALYFSVDLLIVAFAPRAGVDVKAVVVTVYSAINFHHYVVDGLVWKLRDEPVQRYLGVAA